MNKIKDIQIEKIIWLIFIVLSALNIYADTLEEIFFTNNNHQYQKQAKNIFIFTIIISLTIYIFITYRNYKELKEAELYNQDTFFLNIKFFANILIIIGSIMILYYQVNEDLN